MRLSHQHRKQREYFDRHANRRATTTALRQPSKTELRALADHAAATHKITIIPPQRIITTPHK